jgi:hypothetical protein
VISLPEPSQVLQYKKSLGETDPAVAVHIRFAAGIIWPN